MSYTNGLDDPSVFFQTKLYTGTGSSLAITNDGNSNLQPDLVWLKRRDGSTYDHRWNDSVRGVSKTIYSSDTFAENTSDAQVVTSFDSNGFTLGTSAGSNASGVNNVAWQWKASGSTASNTDGTITSTVSANTTAGFSIVTYTGTGSDANVGHSLSSAPQLIITKSRSATGDWKVHTSAIDGSWDVGTLNSTAAFGNSSYTAPTNSIFYVGTGAPTNASGVTYVSYLFHSVKGYSKIGSYTGNGSTDGTFVYTGFKPAFVISKRTASIDGWRIMDATRSPFNVAQHRLLADTSAVEFVGSSQDKDFLSNGFKIRNTDSGYNTSGATYLYYAVAENPFVTSTGIPCTAR